MGPYFPITAQFIERFGLPGYIGSSSMVHGSMVQLELILGIDLRYRNN